jgi:hypothetical protein
LLHLGGSQSGDVADPNLHSILRSVTVVQEANAYEGSLQFQDQQQGVYAVLVS